jgi:DNA-binding IclR family transcriptional regulator
MSATLQTADRALQVLQQFRAPADALSVTEIAGRLGIHRSSASRLVSTLGARGFLERTAVGDLVRLGPEVARLARVTLASRDLATLAQPMMDRLAAHTGETVTLAVPAGDDALTVAQADGSHFVSSGKWVGLRTPLHCTADGKVLLAWDAATPARDGLVRCTDRTTVDPDALERELDDVRRRGFAVSEGEFEQGLVGLAAPVWQDGRCIAALCVSGPQYRLHHAAADELAAVCIACTAELERSLGVRPVEPRGRAAANIGPPGSPRLEHEPEPAGDDHPAADED